jgi:hypothetical protein
MSTIKSSAENLTLNADGANNDIKFQSNGSEVAAIDQAGNLTVSGTVDGVDIQTLNTTASAALPKGGGTMTGALTVNAGISVDNFNINGTTIGLSSGNMELDSGHEIWLDSNDGNFRIKKAGTDIGMIQTTNNDLILRSMVSNEDMLFQGNDGGSAITALTLDMSEGGRAIFNAGVAIGGTGTANTLDDYEEGTWTPNVAFSNSTGSITYGNINNGYYTKIGNTVHITATLHINARSGGSGDMRIGGLPFNNSSVYVNSFAPIYMGIGGAGPNVPSTTYSGPYMQADGHSRDYCDVKVNRDEGDSYKIIATDVKTGNQYWHINGHYTSA